MIKKIILSISAFVLLSILIIIWILAELKSNQLALHRNPELIDSMLFVNDDSVEYIEGEKQYILSRRDDGNYQVLDVVNGKENKSYRVTFFVAEDDSLIIKVWDKSETSLIRDNNVIYSLLWYGKVDIINEGKLSIVDIKKGEGTLLEGEDYCDIPNKSEIVFERI